MKSKSLQLQHLSNKMADFDKLRQVNVPHTGWIKAIRTSE
jgi:hypothetical protein